jgi:hypothetical protein
VGYRAKLLRTETGSARVMLLWVIALFNAVGQSDPLRAVRTRSTEFPQDIHACCTIAASCPHYVETALAGPPLRLRTVSHTPTYDQLRGERINADVPAGEAEPQPVDRPGRHRLRENTAAESAVPPALLGPRVDLAGYRPQFGREKPGQSHENAVNHRPVRQAPQRGENQS